MPYYDYQCDDCRGITQVKASMSEHAAGLEVACGECESTQTKQVFKAMAFVNSGAAGATKEFRPPEGPCSNACACYN